MFPSFNLFGKDISMYALMAVVGLLIAGFVFCLRIRSQGHDDNEAIIFLLILGVGMLVGGHIMFGITNVGSFYLLLSVNSVGEFLNVLAVLFGGSVFYGGLIGAYLLGRLYVRWRRLPLELYMDSAALFAPLFHAFARVGCFFGGCCYGIECEWGIAASGNTITAIGDVPRFPVQLLESVCNLLIAGVIWLVLRRGAIKGRVFYLYLLLYSTVRFFDEMLRGDEIRGFLFGLSTSQLISIPLFLISVFCLLRRRRQSDGSELSATEKTGCRVGKP